jgi:LDH2 family malate/lactate/ureidoglycolate dehydrogenase
MERTALEENEFHHADVLVEAEVTGHPSHGLQRLHHIQRGLMVVALAGSALVPDIRGMLDAEFVCKGDVILAIDLGCAPESVPRLSGYLDLVRAAPPMQAGAPLCSLGDSAARLRSANGFEIEPRLWSELNGPAQSNSSVARVYAL